MTDLSRISLDPAVLAGKPVVRGTRLAVEFVLGLLAEGWSEAEILESYPNLNSGTTFAPALPTPATHWRRRRSIRAPRECASSPTRTFRAAQLRPYAAPGSRFRFSLKLAAGAADETVLARALASGAVILTFDKDFGDLAWRMKPTAAFGVRLFRLPMPRATEAGEGLARIVQSREDWEGHFSVVEPGKIRMQLLGQ